MKNNLLKKYKGKEIGYRLLNYKKIPITHFNNDKEGIDKFNEVYFYVKNGLKLNKMSRTRSGGISINFHKMRRQLQSYSVRVYHNNSGLELVVYFKNIAYRFQWREQIKRDGGRNFRKFIKICEKHKINLDDYKVSTEEGLKIKETLKDHKAPIRAYRDSYNGKTFYDNIHHIDFNSSYGAGLMNSHPEFAPVVKEIYKKRLKDDDFKDVLNHTIGCMQGQPSNYTLSNLARDSIIDNNKRVYDITNKLVRSGRIPLLFNTDGVWYQGKLYKDKNYGRDVGQWKYDYQNVKQFHIKSGGSYEFITEDGKYEARARGIPREKLSKMGDIDIIEVSRVRFNEERGIYYEEKEKEDY